MHLSDKEPAPLAFCSRHLFESTARKLVTDNPKVHFLYGTTVAGLVFGGGHACVAGGAAGDKPAAPAAATVTGEGCCMLHAALQLLRLSTAAQHYSTRRNGRFLSGCVHACCVVCPPVPIDG
jgi:hypothetical protein